MTETKIALVIGGGFAGVFAAQALRRKLSQNWQVELVSERNYFVFQPLLPEVCAGTINSADAVTPLRLLLKGVDVRMGTVTDLDFATQTVQMLQGRRRVPITRHYHHLVIASGQKTDLSRFPGFMEHSLCMRDVAVAHRLRNQILHCLEHADITEDESLKRALLTFVIAGGGFSGVEIAGELREMLDRTLHLYARIHREDVNVVLVQRGARLLPELPNNLGEYAATRLRKRDVTVRLNLGLSRATHSGVFTQEGEFVPSYTLVTTVGNGPGELIKRLHLPMERGRVSVSGPESAGPHQCMGVGRLWRGL